MIKTLNQSQFIDEMTFSKDSSYNNCFSYEGKIALFNYLEDLEESTGEPVECDPIGFCCEYSEYDDIEAVIANYNDIKDLDDLKDNTTVIECSNGHLIIQNF
jgi:hypothetical protein